MNWNGKTVFITGITGFVGSHLAEKLLSLDVNVYGLVRRPSVTSTQNIDHIKEKIKLISGDLQDSSSLKHALIESNPDYVFHLAAQSFVPQSFAAPIETFQTNINGTTNLLEAIRDFKGNIKGILFAGSSEEYGFVKENEIPIKETNPLRPQSPYAISKIACDFMFRLYYKAYGLPTIVTRAFNHTGPRRGEMFVSSVITKQVAEGIKNGKKEIVLGNPEPTRDFTDVRDIVEGYLLAVRKAGTNEIINLCSSKEISIKDLAEKAMSIGKVRMKIVIDKKRYRPAEIPRLYGDNNKAKRLLGWQPKIPIETTLKDMIDYYLKRV